MIKNWIPHLLQRFFRNKTNSLINLLGLTLGMTVSLLIFMYVRHEFGYDSFHTNADRVYRIIKENPKGNNYMSNPKQAVLPAPLADVIKQQLTGVEGCISCGELGWQISRWRQAIATKFFTEDSYHAADGDLFRILTFDALAGNVKRAFYQSIHRSDFGEDSDEVFRPHRCGSVKCSTHRLYKLRAYTIDLVFRDFPTNSSYDFKIVLRFEDFVKTVQPTDLHNWGNTQLQLFTTDFHCVSS